jgi:RsiW-degrading membrane proteinase PrsW (M82 family)
MIVVNVILAIVPSLLLLWYFYRKDVRKKEPPKLIWLVFLMGVISTIPIVVIELLVEYFFTPQEKAASVLFDAFIVAGLVEETIKFAVVMLFVYRRPEFDEVADGLVYTIAAGLGFALVENILYSTGPTYVLILRGVTAVPSHAFTSGIMGYYIGYSKYYENRKMTGLVAAIVLHGLYDLFLFISVAYPQAVAVANISIVIVILEFRWVRKLYREAVQLDADDGRS